MKLIYIMFVSVALSALSWVTLTPIWQYPDEQAHFAQIQNLAESNTINAKNGYDTSAEISISETILATNRTNGNNKYTYQPEFNIPYTNSTEGFFEKELRELPRTSRVNLVKTEATANPPLYYFIGAQFYKFFSEGDLFVRVYSVRIMSLLMYLLLILVSVKFAEIMFEKNILIQTSLPALIAYQPMLIYSSTGVLPDVLTNLLFSLVILIAVILYKKGFSLKRITICLLIIFFGYLTRQQFAISLVILSFVLFLKLYSYMKFQNIRIKSITFTVVLLMLFFSLTLISVPEFGKLNISTFLSPQFHNYLEYSIKNNYSQTLPWYFGVYRWLSLTLPPVTYQIINRVILLSALGLGLLCVNRLLLKKNKKLFEDVFFMLVISFSYFLIVNIWDILHRIKLGYPFGLQGRYFFPTILTNTSIILVGIYFLANLFLKKYERQFIYALVVFVIVFNNFSLFFVTNSFYDISTLDNFINQASQYKPAIFKSYSIIAILILTVLSQLLYAVVIYKQIFIKKNEGI